MNKGNSESFGELKVLLAEKRTSLAVLRTGLALFTIPISVLTILIAASEFYTLNEIFGLFVTLIIICAGLISVGTYLIGRSINKILKIDDRIKRRKEKIAEDTSERQDAD